MVLLPIFPIFYALKDYNGLAIFFSGYNIKDLGIYTLISDIFFRSSMHFNIDVDDITINSTYWSGPVFRKIVNLTHCRLS